MWRAILSEFCGKVLLFGEYSVVKGGKGFALPLFDYNGRLEISKGSYEKGLSAFCEFMSNSATLKSTLDLESFDQDLKDGLIFNSNIPQGAGVGSSGALCAAIYSKYQVKKDELPKRNLGEVMDHLALMESFYHGSSSGLDPLISFAQKPAIVSNRNKVEFVELNPKEFPELYLYNTNFSRKTSPLVHQFLKMCETQEFMDKTKDFIKFSDSLILSFLQGDDQAFDETFYMLSKWQYLNLKPMVCPEIDAFWLEGLESKEYFVKLCGAGGGGHYIIYKRAPQSEMPNGSIKIKF